jgi:hypothetical protein
VTTPLGLNPDLTARLWRPAPRPSAACAGLAIDDQVDSFRLALKSSCPPPATVRSAPPLGIRSVAEIELLAAPPGENRLRPPARLAISFARRRSGKSGSPENRRRRPCCFYPANLRRIVRSERSPIGWAPSARRKHDRFGESMRAAGSAEGCRQVSKSLRAEEDAAIGAVR